MGTTAWTEEDRASVRVQWPPGLRTLDSYEANAVLDLLAGLRQADCEMVRRECYNTFLQKSDVGTHIGWLGERIARLLDELPLLPSDGPPEREGR